MKVRNCWCYYRILQNFVDYFSHQLLPQISRRNSPQISRIRTAGIIIRCAFYITNDNLKSEQTIAFPNHIVNFEPVHSTNITFYHSQVTKTAVFVCVCVSLCVLFVIELEKPAHTKISSPNHLTDIFISYFGGKIGYRGDFGHNSIEIWEKYTFKMTFILEATHRIMCGEMKLISKYSPSNSECRLCAMKTMNYTCKFDPFYGHLRRR